MHRKRRIQLTISVIVFYIVNVINIQNIYSDAKQHSISIATGDILEGHYIVGLQLCKYITKSNKSLKCDVVSTSGSIESLNLLHDGKVDMAIVQSNLALDAFEGEGYFKDKNHQPDLKQIITLYEQLFTIIVKDDDHILTFEDLEGKNISNGVPLSDSSIIYDELKDIYNLHNPLPYDIELSPAEYTKAFCSKKIDAIMLMAGYPDVLVNHITHNCEADFLGLDDRKIDQLIQTNSAYKKTQLKKGIYPGIDDTVNTVSVSSIVVTNSKLSSKVIENFMQYFTQRIAKFKLVHPALQDLPDDNFTKNYILPKAIN